jgi:hypothetical protein
MNDERHSIDESVSRLGYKDALQLMSVVYSLYYLDQYCGV